MFHIQIHGNGLLTRADVVPADRVALCARQQADRSTGRLHGRAAGLANGAGAYLYVRPYDRGLLGNVVSTYRWNGTRWEGVRGRRITGLEGRVAFNAGSN